MTYTVRVQPEDIAIPYQPGANLLTILQGAGFLSDVPCGGRGSCGKCKATVIGGTMPPVSDTEAALLSEDELACHTRLACLVYPESELVVRVRDAERGHPILTGGYLPKFSLNPTARREQSLATFGLAIDIGTTTVVAALVDLRSGREAAVRSALNAQRPYGLDVLTRITYVLEHPEDGLEKLRGSVIASLNEMTAELCREAGIAPRQIYDVTVAANNTMLHILLGVSPIPIGQAPFTPVFRSAQNLWAAELGLELAEDARVYCLPSVSSYVGADIVAGAYVCGLHREMGNVLFLDIGTNGEMVLAYEGKLLCCSCAAGPALEGMNISCGMRASVGAVEDVNISGGDASVPGVTLSVIGGGPPAGLCGSGVLAVVSELVRTGLIGPSGRIGKAASFPQGDFRRSLLMDLNGKAAIRLAERVWITQTDIRQVQLAKGAILSGVYALLNKAGIAVKALNRVLVAGQFGSHLPVKSLTGCGILPRNLSDRVEYVGNTSQNGAFLALVSSAARSDMERLAGDMSYFELSAVSGYETLFARCLSFAESA